MYQVYYFTRTGNSERIAKKIAAGLSCEAFRITDRVDWSGIGIIFKFLRYADGKKDLNVTSDGNPADADELIVVSPIWGSRLTPTVRQFLAPIAKNRVRLVTSSAGSPLRDPEGYKSVTGIMKSKKNEDEMIRQLLLTLRGEAASGTESE